MAETTRNPNVKIRHPEKAGKEDQISVARPNWIRVKAPAGPGYQDMNARMRTQKLVTVCEEAACPNIGECWTQNHAAFMIMGEVCTRSCAFCNVATGRPSALDQGEPDRLADTVAELGLSHVVVTSVDRDDLPDGGAKHFANVVRAIRTKSPTSTIETLTPDFFRKDGALEVMLEHAPDVFNHNLECVPRLYPEIRPGARYYGSLRLLDRAKALKPEIFTKSGLMLGLGETDEEVLQVLDDMRTAGVDFLTLGQYLQPTPKHAAVKRYVSPDEFAELKRRALSKGFLQVSATPLTRSSYHADKDFKELQAAREASLKAR